MKTKVDVIEIEGVRYVPESEAQAKMAEEIDGMKFCIIRAKDAGCHAGYVAEKNPAEKRVVLFNSRRLWRWWGKTLSGLATEGTFAPEKCKFADPIPEIEILDYCECIPCTEKARKSIMEDVGPWVND